MQIAESLIRESGFSSLCSLAIIGLNAGSDKI
jgi:hypothetical protein